MFQVELLSLSKRVKELFNQVDIHVWYVGVERQYVLNEAFPQATFEDRF